ncbi:hypothetical protein FB451DRAFT_1363894 [Mycena latifolia]|nr:hypothetical protein FB451DRAFT_1363894 [Mycena latifolia]
MLGNCVPLCFSETFMPRRLSRLAGHAELTTIVKSVTFSTWQYNRPRGGIVLGPDTRWAPDPSTIPPMPSVRIVTWESSLTADVVAAAPRLSLFPNITELHLTCFFSDFDSLSKLLGACGRLKVLALKETTVPSDSRIDKSSPHTGLFDLTALEKLDIHCIDPANYIIDLVDHSTPLQLKYLIFGDSILSGFDDSCSIATMAKLLRLSADSLEHLILDPAFGSQAAQGLDMFQRLPAFPALTSLEVRLAPDPTAETLLRACPPAPNVTEIRFRIQFHEDDEDGFETDLETFREIMEMGIVQKNLLKDLLLVKFPRFQRLVFHFSAPDLSEFHYEQSIRRDVEDTVRAKIPDAGERLSFQWFQYGLDYKDHPATYSKYGYLM